MNKLVRESILKGPTYEEIITKIMKMDENALSERHFKVLLENNEIALLLKIIRSRTSNMDEFYNALRETEIKDPRIIKEITHTVLNNKRIFGNVTLLHDCIYFGLIDEALFLLSKSFDPTVSIYTDEIIPRILNKSESENKKENFNNFISILHDITINDIVIGPYTVDLLVEKNMYDDLKRFIDKGLIRLSIINKLKDKSLEDKKLRKMLESINIF